MSVMGEPPTKFSETRRDLLRVMISMRKAEDDESYCSEQKLGIQQERRYLESLYNDSATPENTLAEALKKARMHL